MKAPAATKSKKTLVHLAISIAIALLFAVLTVGVVYVLATSYIKSTHKEKNKLNTQLSSVKEELDRLKQESLKLGANSKLLEAQEATATGSIAMGTVVTTDMIAFSGVEASKKRLDTFSDLSSLVGKMVIKPLQAGEAFTTKNVVDSTGLYQLPQGTRAMTVALDPVGSLGGKLLPGSFIDVLLTVNAEAGAYTRTLLQRVQVIGLAVTPEEGKGQAQAKGKESKQMVTLAITPKEAEMLALAQNQGTFHFTLRSFDDTETTALAGVDMEALKQGKPKVPSKPVRLGRLPQLPADFSKNLSPLLLQGAYNNPITAGFSASTGSKPEKFSMEVFKGANSETFEFEKH